MSKDQKTNAAQKRAGKQSNSATNTTKSAAVLSLLAREQGSTLTELTAATGWQPHTARAMLTGLRKKGHAIERGKRDDVTCYYLLAPKA